MVAKRAPAGMKKQMVTAVFALRGVTRRKHAALERVRAAAEDAYWTVLEIMEKDADTLETEAASLKQAATPVRKNRIAQILRGINHQLAEGVMQGLIYGVDATIASYIGLRANGRKASWPKRGAVKTYNLDEAIDQVGQSETMAGFVEASHGFAEGPKAVSYRPFTLLRGRDCSIHRCNSEMAVALKILWANHSKSRVAEIKAGIDAVTQEPENKSLSKRILLFPIVCSKWHENIFLSGKSHLKSAKIVRVGETWEMHAQFEFLIPEITPSPIKIGIDRGCVFPAAIAVVDGDGKILEVPGLRGAEISKAFRERADLLRQQQKNGASRRIGKLAGVSPRERNARTKIGRTIDHALHSLANELVNLGKQYSAQIVIENLDAFKDSMIRKRPRNSKKNAWNQILKRAQVAKLEALLTYKLKMAGLPALKKVVANGTSQICPACGHRSPENRKTRDEFSCISCNYEIHADICGAINIARRGLFEPKKGISLDTRHRDMVERLISLDDGGLGPVADFGHRVVAVHTTVSNPYDPTATGLRLSTG